MMPSGHKAFLVHNPADVDLLLMHNKTFAAEYVSSTGAIFFASSSNLIEAEECIY